MSRYEEIETFVRVVEAGSITGAASQMRMAKSAVSRRLKELETRLGVQLIIRSTRKLTLTETGRALYDRSVVLLSDWAETESIVSEAQTNLSGSIRVAAPLSFGVAHLGPAILDFIKLHPEVDFDIDFSDRLVDLIADGMDVAVRIGRLPDSSLIARKLADICTVMAVSPAFLEQHGPFKSPDDIRHFKSLAYGYRQSLEWPYVTPDGKPGHIELKPRLRATNGEFLRDAAIAGEGIILVPRFIIYESLQDGSLVEILSEYQWPEIGAYAVYPPTRHLSARVRAFVDFIAERFKGTPYWEM